MQFKQLYFVWSVFWKPHSEVLLVGTAPYLCKMGRPLTPVRAQQLRRIKKFFKVQTAKSYTSSAGQKRCVRAQTLCQEHPFVIFRVYWSHHLTEAGGKDLKSTQVYPGALGIQAWLLGNSSIVWVHPLPPRDTFFCFALSSWPRFNILLAKLIVYEVAALLKKHLKQHASEACVTCDGGLEFCDSGDESDDSGLEDLLHTR